jgi:hypothetical protein
MPISSVQILAVGPTTLSTLATLRRLVRSGWSSHPVSTVREAETVLKTIRFNVVLAAERLADGVAYDLAPIIGRQGGTLYVGVALSETCLWLPVVERGVRSLGERALNSAILESEVAEVLRREQDGITMAAAGAISPQLRIELTAREGGIHVLAGESVLDIDAHSLQPGYPHAFNQQAAPRSGGYLRRATSKSAIPARRKPLDHDAGAVTTAQTLSSGHTKPNVPGKSWRG